MITDAWAQDGSTAATGAAFLPLILLIALIGAFIFWRSRRRKAVAEAPPPLPMEVDAAFKLALERSNNLFGFFGHAITTVTWISFCVVTIAVLVKIAQVPEVQQMRSGGSARFVWGGVLVTAFASVSSSIFLFIRLVEAASAAKNVYIASQRGFLGWFRKKTAEYMFGGAPYLVVIVAGSLSYQALIALSLLPLFGPARAAF